MPFKAQPRYGAAPALLLNVENVWLATVALPLFLCFKGMLDEYDAVIPFLAGGCDTYAARVATVCIMEVVFEEDCLSVGRCC